MKPVLLFLTCANEQEAHNITNMLLEERLVACIKWQTITSHFIWQNKKESATEILLIMDSIEEHYESIHARVKELHSYSTFVLVAVPIIKTSDEVRAWLSAELRLPNI